jgi:acyl-CoA reductase-like NAD-dependent aldehyde dehydrogenase
MGAYFNNRRSDIILSDYKGQSCIAGSRIFVQEGIYNEFLNKFTATAAHLASKTGDPFDQGTEHGPQVSKVQFDVCLCSMDFFFSFNYSLISA